VNSGFASSKRHLPLPSYASGLDGGVRRTAAGQSAFRYAGVGAVPGARVDLPANPVGAVLRATSTMPRPRWRCPAATACTWFRCRR
jgi:hypothetical protein